MPASPSKTPAITSPRTSLRTIHRWIAAGQKFPVLTCYDATTARWLTRGGVNCLLVGDTAAQLILGYESTLPADLDFMVQITAAVRRGAPNAFVIADMPLGSYHCGDDLAVANALRFVKQGLADAVKLEVDAHHAPLLGRMISTGIPVVAHLGARPQQYLVQGGYRSAAKNTAQAKQLLDATRLILQQRPVMLLLEAVPPDTTAKIVNLAADLARRIHEPPTPVIGCGAGPACHAHVVVLHDLLGMSDWQPPFAKPLTNLGQLTSQAAQQWADLITSGKYPPATQPKKTSKK